MSNSFVISGLVEKRAELSGLITDLEERTHQARADMAHIDAALKLFDPDSVPQNIRPKAPAAARSGFFANGEISRRCREAVRRANGDPISAEDIVRWTMSEKGLDPEDAKIRYNMIKRFLGALHRLQMSGAIGKIGHGLGARWTRRP
ncbi:hypothetical protein [Rhodopila sp.]|uniref:hypothetical protein n=1 Tax=Rhodopila sp. TaxID=2480087 RepID=UPI003D0CF61B